MSYFQIILKEWREQVLVDSKREWMQRIASAKVGVSHYESYLVETYHHAGINPQIQAYATMFLKSNPRDMIKRFYQHAISEIGHDLLALNDLEALGVERKRVVNSRPLPETLGLNAYATHCIQFNNVLSYLGYLFHLEFMPTQNGEGIISALKTAGVPPNALTFLEEHSEVDVTHNKFMESYCSNLVLTQEDCDEVSYAARSVCVLQHNMIAAAMDRVERGEIFWR